MTARSLVRWASLCCAAAIAIVLLLAGPARAHGAKGLAFQAIVGKYLVSVFDGRRTTDPSRAEYRIVLTGDPGDGLNGLGAPNPPVPDAAITVVDSAGKQFAAEGIGNVYLFTLRDIAQRVHISIRGPAGPADFDVALHGTGSSSPGDHSGRTLVVGTAGALSLAIVGGLLWVRVRRRLHPAPPEGASPVIHGIDDGNPRQSVDLTLLYFDGCPHWRTFDERLKEALTQLGLPLDISYGRVETDKDAEARGMRGSPTLLLDGADPFSDSGVPSGLACRLYNTPSGTRGVPTVEQLVEMLRPGDA